MSATIPAAPFASLEDDEAQRQLDAHLAALKARHRTPKDARWTEARVRDDVADEPTPSARTLAYLDRLVPEVLAEVAEAAETIVEALSYDRLPDSPEYTVQEVVGWVARAFSMGCAFPRLSGAELEKVWTGAAIPNARLREAFLERAEDADALASALAYAAGMIADGRPDVTRVLRLLGIEPGSKRGDALQPLALFIPCEHAAHFADALGLDYHDLGL